MHIRFCPTQSAKGISDLALLQHVMTTIAWAMRCIIPEFETRERGGEQVFCVSGTSLGSRNLLETYFTRFLQKNISTSVIGHAFAFRIGANFTRARRVPTQKGIALKATMTTDRKDSSFSNLYWLNAAD